MASHKTHWAESKKTKTKTKDEQRKRVEHEHLPTTDRQADRQLQADDTKEHTIVLYEITYMIRDDMMCTYDTYLHPVFLS